MSRLLATAQNHCENDNLTAWKYHKKRGVAEGVIARSTVVEMIASGYRLKLDQTHLVTVIPAPGKRILDLNGIYKRK